MKSPVLDELQFFQAACADGYGVARKAASEGRKVAGYMCSYSPQELLHAAGYLPVRVIGRLGATPHADDCLADYMDTSRSIDGLTEGQTNAADIGPGVVQYFQSKGYVATSQEKAFSGDLWKQYMREIDQGRPVLMVVDRNGETSAVTTWVWHECP